MRRLLSQPNWLRLVKSNPVSRQLIFFERCEDLSCPVERASGPQRRHSCRRDLGSHPATLRGIGFVPSNPPFFQSQRKIASYRKLASFGQNRPVGQASWPVHSGQARPRQRRAYAGPLQAAPGIGFVPSNPPSLQSQRKIISYRELASFGQTAANGARQEAARRSVLTFSS